MSLAQEQQTKPVGKFNAKVLKLYKSMTNTIQQSNSILNRSAPVMTETSPVRIAYSANDDKQDKKTSSVAIDQNDENNKSLRVENEYVTLPTGEENSGAYITMPTVDEEDNLKLKIYEVILRKKYFFI